MRSVLLGLTLLISSQPGLGATACLGKAGAARQIIYLHGFIHEGKRANEETENLAVLKELAREARIAQPEGEECPGRKKCWPSKDAVETQVTMDRLLKASAECLDFKKPYILLGFSNGGYFAFKWWKISRDKNLKQILTSGSAGVWIPRNDVLNKDVKLTLMMGSKDITLAETKRLKAQLGPTVPLLIFAGGHRLDLATIQKALSPGD